MVEICGMGLRSGGRTLIRRECRVALDERYAIEPYTELFGDQLCLSSVEPVPQFTLAGVGGHAAVRANGDPRIQLIAAGTIKTLS